MGELASAVRAVAVAVAQLQAASVEDVSHRELVGALTELQSAVWSVPAVEHRVVARLVAETDPRALGAKNWPEVLRTALRISSRDAKQRLDEAARLGPRRAVTGEPLEPMLARVAAAQERGSIGPEHVKILMEFFAGLPVGVDVVTRDQAERDLVGVAEGHGPAAVAKAASRLAYLLDQDGELPSDAERARKRGLTLGPQQPDGMSRLTGWLDPQARATWEAVTAKDAAPGMCNPDDENPCIDGDPGDDRRRRDIRSQAQRNHDAFVALGRDRLASGRLGQHNGLPATIIVSTTLQDLEAAAGHGVTGGGSLLPMQDVIRLAAHAHHYLYIYDKHTSEPLHLGRTRRLASTAQRLVLHAVDRGCTFPGCDVPGYGCQVHHATADWADGGNTDINDLALACGPHNRLVEKGGWSTRKRKDGRTEWIPPLVLDTGQTRVNNFHHPERYLVPGDDDP
ncbi:HNH endonuclease signature motif containing protein [Mycolicibacterium vaccae]|uniref:HNH endonuclease signature motif containing protein n=1 Tax=Mycolicibacterium vaccae TaxID=1810 RepID=UPI003CE89618